MTYNGFQGWQSQPLQQQMQQMPAEETETAGTETESTSQGSTFEYSDFASQILKEAPDEHKAILEPYLSKWDAGTTRRFQDLHNQYKPFADLGWDEETTTQMAEVYRVLNEEPERLYEILKAEFESNVAEETQKPGVEVSESGQAIQGLPPEITAQLEQQQQVLEALAQIVIKEQTSKTEAVEDSEFEGYMGLLKKEYGEFDEEYVTMMIANGSDGEAAVKQYQNMIQEHINRASEATNGLPPAMLSSAGGGAVVQQEPQKLGSIPDRDIRTLIANVMSQANQAGQ